MKSLHSRKLLQAILLSAVIILPGFSFATDGDFIPDLDFSAIENTVVPIDGGLYY
jgi:hypothetical protein